MPRDLAHERDLDADDLARLMTRLRLEEARALSRVPHVRHAVRTAEALVEHPLGGFPDLHAEIERDEWGRDRLSYWTRLGVFLFVAAGSFVTAWLFIQMGVAVWEAMERAAAEAMSRGPH